MSASTTLYGMYQFKKKTSKIQAIRHTLTPSFGFSYAPDFSDQKYGYYKTVQTDSTGKFQVYSPFADNAYGVPSSGRSMSMNFSLSQTLEMKVLSKRDTSGIKKIKLIDNLSVSASYNFLADSMKLSTIPIQFRTTVFGTNFGIQLNATLDPYRVTPEGRRIDKLFFPGRIVSTGWSFGYTFKSRQDNSTPAINDINSVPPEYANPFYDPYGILDPVLRRQYMAQSYYDFSLPWNLGFNYTVSYSINYVNNGTTGYRKNITQNIGFNGSVNLTPKMGITFQGGYDIKENKLTTSSVSISRDLHCWQMSRTRRDGKAFPCPIFGISTHADHEKVHHLRIVSGPRCRYVLRTGASPRRRLQQGSGRHLSEEIDEPLRTHPQQGREPSLHTGTNPAAIA